MRELDDVLLLMRFRNSGIVNLKKHGFLMFADTIENMRQLVSEAKYMAIN